VTLESLLAYRAAPGSGDPNGHEHYFMATDAALHHPVSRGKAIGSATDSIALGSEKDWRSENH
jgi:hypothetical protein